MRRCNMINFKDFYRNKWVQYGLIYTLFFVVLIKVKITGGDDELYKNIISQRNFFEWLYEVYILWSGRIVLTGALALILNLPIMVWKIMTAGIFTLAVWLIEKITRKSEFVRWSTVALILLIPSPILNSSAFWITGSLNYLWPYVSMLFVIWVASLILHNKMVNHIYLIISYFAGFLAANNEQTGIVLSVLFFLILAYRWMNDHRVEIKYLALFIFIILNFLFLMLAPGNYLRFQSELISLQPYFKMYDMFDKLAIGFNYTFEILFNQFKYLLLILSIFLVLKSLSSKLSVKIVSLYSLLLISFKILMDYVILTYPFWTFGNDLHYILFTYKYLALNFNERFSLYYPILIGISYLVSVALVLFHGEDNNAETRIMFSLMWVGSILSSVILGFSPTIEASGNRIYFVMAMGLVITMAHIIASIEQSQKYRGLLRALTIILIYEAIQIAFAYYNVFDFTVLY